jgi:hypothetical protein
VIPLDGATRRALVARRFTPLRESPDGLAVAPMQLRVCDKT